MIHGCNNKLIIISALTIMSCCFIMPGAWAATALQGEGVGLVTGVPGTASVRATE